MNKPKFIPPVTRAYRDRATGKVKLKPLERKYPKIGRNSLCPCGSGLKFKKCHLEKMK